MNNKHLHVGPGGLKCQCCFPPPSSKARAAKFRSAKRRDRREAMASALADMTDDREARCDCGRYIEDGEPGPHCRQCRWYWEDYAAMSAAEIASEFSAD